MVVATSAAAVSGKQTAYQWTARAGRAGRAPVVMGRQRARLLNNRIMITSHQQQ